MEVAAMESKNTLLDFKSPTRKYDKYCLESNPFPYVGVPDETLSLYTNRKRELKMIEEVIKVSLQGASSHIVLVGSYGNGKTHTLKYVKQQMESQLHDITTVYIANPGERFLSLYSNFIYELGFDQLENLVWRFLEFCTGEKNLRKKVNEGEVLLPEILEIGKRRLHNEIKYTDFATAFLKLTLEECKFIAWKYLCGEPILYEQRKELDVVMLIDNDEKALRAFMSLKKILSLLGNKLICLLIDEFEFIEYLHPLLKQKILNSIRHLIDLNPKGLCLIISCAPEVWSNILKEYHAFSERIFRQVTLKALNERDMRNFVSSYLQHFRIKDEDPPTDIFPFTEDAITAIQRAAEGNIRRMLMICNQAIDIGADMNLTTINAEKLKEMLPDIFEFFPSESK
jgi:type II secretory pathway predicted ATPase ExeA